MEGIDMEDIEVARVAGGFVLAEVVPPAAASESGEMAVSPKPDERGERMLEQTYQ